MFLKCLCVIFRIQTRTFGCRHSVAGHQARDLGQDLGAVQLVTSVESVSVERIGFGQIGSVTLSIQGNMNRFLSNRQPET